MGIKNFVKREKSVLLLMTGIIVLAIAGSGLFSHYSTKRTINEELPSAVEQEIQKQSEQIQSQMPESVTKETLVQQDNFIKEYLTLVKAINTDLDFVTRDTDNTEQVAKIQSNVDSLSNLVSQAKELYTDDSPNSKKWLIFNGFIGLYCEAVNSSLANYSQNMFDEGNKFLESANKNYINAKLASDFYTDDKDSLAELLSLKINI